MLKTFLYIYGFRYIPIRQIAIMFNRPIVSISFAIDPPENINISETTMPCPYDEPVLLTCNASGYPLPTFQWFDLTNGGNSFYEGPTVEINRGGTYQCLASNTIRDVAYSEKSMPVNVSDCCK